MRTIGSSPWYREGYDRAGSASGFEKKVGKDRIWVGRESGSHIEPLCDWHSDWHSRPESARLGEQTKRTRSGLEAADRGGGQTGCSSMAQSPGSRFP